MEITELMMTLRGRNAPLFGLFSSASFQGFLYTFDQPRWPTSHTIPLYGIEGRVN